MISSADDPREEKKHIKSLNTETGAVSPVLHTCRFEIGWNCHCNKLIIVDGIVCIPPEF